MKVVLTSQNESPKIVHNITYFVCYVLQKIYISCNSYDVTNSNLYNMLRFCKCLRSRSISLTVLRRIHETGLRSKFWDSLIYNIIFPCKHRSLNVECNEVFYEYLARTSSALLGEWCSTEHVLQCRLCEGSGQVQ